MAPTKKMALLRVTPEALRTLLQLPDATEIVRVELADGHRGVMHLMIEGAGWETEEGSPVMPADSAIITETVDAAGALVSRLVDWGFPTSRGD